MLIGGIIGFILGSITIGITAYVALESVFAKEFEDQESRIKDLKRENARLHVQIARQNYDANGINFPNTEPTNLELWRIDA